MHRRASLRHAEISHLRTPALSAARGGRSADRKQPGHHGLQPETHGSGARRPQTRGRTGMLKPISPYSMPRRPTRLLPQRKPKMIESDDPKRYSSRSAPKRRFVTAWRAWGYRLTPALWASVSGLLCGLASQACFVGYPLRIPPGLASPASAGYALTIGLTPVPFKQ